VIECYARPTPPDQLDEVAAAWDGMNDAPTDDLEWDDVHFDGERLRLAEAYEAALGRRGYVAVARHARTGAIAGLSELSLPAGATHAHQGDTCVLAAHRGHRLGLLVKLAMLDLLAEQEPQVAVIDTWNATSNAPMIAVNDALGCTPGVTSTEWVLDLQTAL
jgi:GNAT superfamily N-acetyltransferase